MVLLQKLNKKELTVFLTDLNELKPVSVCSNSLSTRCVRFLQAQRPHYMCARCACSNYARDAMVSRPHGV
jgi:hypothetical protein